MKKRRRTETRKTSAPAAEKPAIANTSWTFLTNHSHVLVCLHRNPESTLREVAALVGITERMVQKIVAELVEADYLSVTKVGRRNTYEIRLQKSLRHSLESHRSIGDILRILQRE